MECSVTSCQANKEDRPELLFFSMPRQYELRKVWLQRCGIYTNPMPAILANKQFYVCQQHFDPSDYRIVKVNSKSCSQRNILNKDVVPHKSIPRQSVTEKFVYMMPEEDPLTLPDRSVDDIDIDHDLSTTPVPEKKRKIARSVRPRGKARKRKRLPSTYIAKPMKWECCVISCGANKTDCPDLILFVMPKEYELRNVWLQRCGLYVDPLPAVLANKMLYVCQKHFDPSDYRSVKVNAKRYFQRHLLNKDVLPHKSIPRQPRTEKFFYMTPDEGTLPERFVDGMDHDLSTTSPPVKKHMEEDDAETFELWVELEGS
ncbi:uncharacterized protein LOC128734562 [Sabethes cyaneus]|uniref:uncharacterized protein LOC128734562 n=1 Tax=Sabethes cyaneus TaxID=53552 RepID=UPI00237DD647|nr:uncharacterized protein LOC128734562 [Sabethes cyaneus]